VQAYIATMPGWKSHFGRRLDALIEGAAPGVRKAVKWHSPLYEVESQGMVPRHPVLHEVRQGGFLPLDEARRLGEASQQIARRTNVSGQRELREWSPEHRPRAHESRDKERIRDRQKLR
jgi:hypothetical protein